MAIQEKKDDVFAAQLLYREIAYYITRREEYERALTFFDASLSRNPTDKRALIGRSWARSKVCEYAGALDDIAQALKQDPGDLIVTAHQALNTYLCCKFEDALVSNLRMVPKRKKPDNFAMGVMHCYEAIENGIGMRAGRPLRDHFKIIRRLAWKKMRTADKPFEAKTKHKKKKKSKEAVVKKKTIKEPVVPLIRCKGAKNVRSMKSSYLPPIERLAELREDDDEKEIRSHNLESNSASKANSPSFYGADDDLYIRDSLHTPKTESDYVPPGKPFHYRPLQRYTTNIENYMAEKYLDNMYLDKIFLKYINVNPGISSPNIDGTKNIIIMAKEGYKRLSYKQELLRTRRPFYYIKYQETKLSPALTARILHELRKMQAASKKDADALLNKMRTEISMKLSQAALDTAEKLKKFCDSQPKKVLPLKEDYLKKMYKLAARAYYLLFRINPYQNHWLQKRRIYYWFGAQSIREPSTDSIISQFKNAHIDWRKRVLEYEDRLRKAVTSEEMSWIYHELARTHTELRQFELARVYARKCISEGRASNSIHWIINAMMMLAKINIQQHNRNDAKGELLHTLDVARRLGDACLIEYIEMAIEVAEEMSFDEHFGTKILEQREQQIIQMMAVCGMKEEVTHLFRKMAVMPASRRMSVMPGVKLEDAGKSMPSGARKMSILPTPKEEESTVPTAAQPRASVASAAANKKTEESSKGIGFMELIKYHVEQ